MERLWTPWRSDYITGAHAVDGCVFCQIAAASDDDANLVVARGEHVFVVMNLFPYNSGHIMIVPYRHLDDPAALSPDERREVMDWQVDMVEACRATLRPEGFNIGMNVGRAAGAGIADHLHLHIVPRWVGDTNFMPVLGATKVLPELLPATLGRLRAALATTRAAAENAAALAAAVPPTEPIGASPAEYFSAPPAAVPMEPFISAESVITPPPPIEAVAPAEAMVTPPSLAEPPSSETPAASTVAAGFTDASAPDETLAAVAEPDVPAPPMEPIEQAGAVVLINDKVVLRRTHDGSWVLPKGHIEAGETAEQTAAREVEEEMGLRGALGPLVGKLTFMQNGRERHVRYFLLRDARPLPSFSEHLGRDTFVLSARDALGRLTHADARTLLTYALEVQRAERH